MCQLKAVGLLSETKYHKRIGPVASFVGAGGPVGGHGASEAVAKGMTLTHPENLQESLQSCTGNSNK